jgi:hypothetical protein
MLRLSRAALMLTLAGMALPGLARAQETGSSILEQVLSEFDRQYGLGSEDVSVFVNFAQNYNSVQVGAPSVTGPQSVTGAIVSNQTPPVIGRGPGVPQTPFNTPGGTLTTTVVGSSNTGTIDVGLTGRQGPFSGPATGPTDPVNPVGTTSVMVNGSANSVSINGSVQTQPDMVPTGPGSVSSSAMGAVNFGSTKLVSAAQSTPYLLPGRSAFGAGGTP